MASVWKKAWPPGHSAGRHTGEAQPGPGGAGERAHRTVDEEEERTRQSGGSH